MEAAMAPPSEIRIGVVGLGHMGDAFAENLLADGYSVTVFDRDTARAQALAGKGA
ncbi:MAG: NAD(P)-binding domain-containing protein, partial [Rhodopila sp.]